MTINASLSHSIHRNDPLPGRLIGYVSNHPAETLGGAGLGIPVCVLTTGEEVMVTGASVRRLPRGWRTKVEFVPIEEIEDAPPLRRTPDLTDWVQETVIARARELGLTAYAIAKRTDGKVSEDHVKNYLERRSSMGSHKLQHVLRALDLGVTPR